MMKCYDMLVPDLVVQYDCMNNRIAYCCRFSLQNRGLALLHG